MKQSTPPGFPPELDATPAQVEQLTAYVALLEKWQARINLVGRGTLDDIWRRHILDSAQLRSFLPHADKPIIADLGSGAGFPGLVLAILGAGEVHLIESDTRKAAFLNEVRRVTGANVTVHAERIEVYSGPPPDIVVSRALAPLAALLGYAHQIGHDNTRAVFLKGRQWQDELTAAQASWHIDLLHQPSVADPAGVVLDIHAFRPLT